MPWYCDAACRGRCRLAGRGRSRPVVLVLPVRRAGGQEGVPEKVLARRPVPRVAIQALVQKVLRVRRER